MGGAIAFFIFESFGEAQQLSLDKRIADAWFQSITFRTAGFNTVDHGQMQPTTKLMAIGFMFIGASPGSTGGGVKTVCIAVAFLALLSILRGRSRVEFQGRTIPQETVNRAFSMISLGLMTVLLSSIMIVFFEKNEQGVLNQLFEVMSAFGTVGVSTGITGELSTPSQYVIIVSMFLGRVGPLTLILALSRQSNSAFYEYPQERVLLG